MLLVWQIGTFQKCPEWEKEKKILLLFEPSRQKRDWIHNFDIPVKIYKKQQSCLKVARGWGKAYKSCNDEIMHTFITQVQSHSGYEPVICGWSYGGAMSLLACEDFYFRTQQKPCVYTFGAPKPLWGGKTKKYVRSCVKTVKQYAHINDIVPHLPPALFGYKAITKNTVGAGFSLINIFKPQIFHCCYGSSTLYSKEDIV